MLSVFILEDDPVQLQQMKNDVDKIGTDLGIKIESKTFSNISDLKNTLPQPSRSNIFILDLDFNNKNQTESGSTPPSKFSLINSTNNYGLEVSKFVRAHDLLASLIFITAHDEFLFLYHTYKYRVSALDFIAKNYSDIHDELQKDIQQVQKYLQINNTEKPFTYKDYSNTININFMNINYFESNSINSHSSILNTVNNQQLKLNYNLRDIEKLDNRFFRAHRSYLVNVKQIDHVDLRKRLIHFHNGDRCSVSKLHLRALLKLIS